MTRARVLVTLLVGLAAPATAADFALTSPAFAPGQPVPTKYTCQGSNVSPPLAWTAPPAGTKSLALIVDDPDAPDPAAPQRVFVHWVVYNLPPAAGSQTEGAALPAGARDGKGGSGRTGYGGPCPPIGRHRYFFKLYALDTVLPDLGAPTRSVLDAAMKGHVLATAELMGTYQK